VEAPELAKVFTHMAFCNSEDAFMSVHLDKDGYYSVKFVRFNRDEHVTKKLTKTPILLLSVNAFDPLTIVL